MDTFTVRGEAIVGRWWLVRRWAGITLTANARQLRLQGRWFGSIELEPQDVVALTVVRKWWWLQTRIEVTHTSRIAPPVLYYIPDARPDAVLQSIAAAGFRPA